MTRYRTVFGIFRWNPENRYREDNHLKRFKYRPAAEKTCDKWNDKPPAGLTGPERGFVVRSFEVEDIPEPSQADIDAWHNSTCTGYECQKL